MSDKATEEREVISPEGVEERLIEEFVFRITLTGGGKYRVYGPGGKETRTMGVYDTLAEAKKDAGYGMLILGGLIRDPEKTLDILLKKGALG